MEAFWSSSCAYRAAPPDGCLLRSSRRPLFVPPPPPPPAGCLLRSLRRPLFVPPSPPPPAGCLLRSLRRPLLVPPSPPPPAAAVVATNLESRGNRMFVFGTGFVGRYVSEQLKLEGWEVSGTCRSAIKKGELEEIGLDAFLFDVHKSKLRSLPTLQHATHVLISIPPVVGSNDPLLCLHEDLRSTLSSGNLQWLCYLSSTSVYGDSGGAWVNEDYPVNPESESAKLRFIAEKGWLDLGRELGVPTNILRLGGIYGPGRSALDTIIKQKLTSEKQKKRESRSYTARVHVADIYQAVKASLDSQASGRIYNVADDDPAPREEVFAYARSLIEERWPGMIDELSDDVTDPKPKKRNIGEERWPGMIDELSDDVTDPKPKKRNIGEERWPGMIDELSDDVTDPKPKKRIIGGEKRVSNARLKEELGVKLLYPTYRSGLRSIIDSWNPQFNMP